MTTPSNSAAEILLANPRGFCAGVSRAVEIVEHLLEEHGAPVFVKHEIVHNRHVCDRLRARGAVFIEDVDIVPEGALLVFSAHGVSQAVRAAAKRRQLQVVDATCPLVTKVHAEVARLRRQGFSVVIIGHRGHPEVEGTLGQADSGVYLVEDEDDLRALPFSRDEKVAYVTQTTLSVDDTARVVAALRARWPQARAPHKNDICYATQNRQDAVKQLAKKCDVILVVGSASSSNSNRLREVAEHAGARAFLIEDANAVNPAWLRGARAIGVTAGASAPADVVREVPAVLKKHAPEAKVEEMPGIAETVVFAAPKNMPAAARGKV